MTTLASWLLILFIAGVVFGCLATLCELGMRFRCAVNHWRIRRYGAQLDCGFCGELVIEAYHEPELFSLGRVSGVEARRGHLFEEPTVD